MFIGQLETSAHITRSAVVEVDHNSFATSLHTSSHVGSSETFIDEF